MECIVSHSNELLVLDHNSVVIEDKDVIIGPLWQIKQVLTLDPVRVDVLPVSCDGVLCCQCTLCVILAHNNEGLPVQWLLLLE